MKWCHFCDAGQAGASCWLCGGLMDVKRPSWITGKHASLGQHPVAHRPEGKLLCEIVSH